MSPDGFTTSDTWGGLPVAREVSAAGPRSRVVVSGVIRSACTTVTRGRSSYECTLDDGSGRLVLLFVGRRRVPGLLAGTRCRIEGTARWEDDRLVVWNPIYLIEACNG